MRGRGAGVVWAGGALCVVRVVRVSMGLVSVDQAVG